MEEKYVSEAVIRRLPRYYRYLGELIDEGVDHISSQELSERMSVTASQIRQDLNNFGGFGQQGYGYNVHNLYKEIGRILGVEKPHNLIIIGSGNLGKAIAGYKGFSKHGFRFCGMFDKSPDVCGQDIADLTVMPMDMIEDFLVYNHVDIAVITVPKEAAGKVSQDLYDMGIKNFWNFANTELSLPDDAVIKSVHLLDSLLELTFEISRKNL